METETEMPVIMDMTRDTATAALEVTARCILQFKDMGISPEHGFNLYTYVTMIMAQMAGAFVGDDDARVEAATHLGEAVKQAMIDHGRKMEAMRQSTYN